MRNIGKIAFSVALITLATSAVDWALQSSAPEKWSIGPFERVSRSEPILRPQPASVFTDPILKQPIHWEALHTFNPGAVVRDGKVVILYRAEDNTGSMEIGGHTSRLGFAESEDGIHFTRRPTPVFYPADDNQKAREWPGGVEDPRVVELEDGTYILTYTQWNRVTYSIGIASSKDLLHWEKYGPAFYSALGGKYQNLKYKSGGIVTTLSGGRLKAVKIHGKYWMYWGEGEVHLATSDDAIHWTPMENGKGDLLVVLRKRPGHFDSGFPEVGPPPVLTKAGIVVLYNGKNDPTAGDPALGANAYGTGQALFSADEPAKLLARAESPFLKPELPYEKSGQYAAGTTFSEGLVYFHDKWFLYYGCADSLVSGAMAEAIPKDKKR